ncbi:MAG: DoxX family protein [Planctomycetes bacterium]|nr:DoxX family protein [Planctomycetota bacterium]
MSKFVPHVAGVLLGLLFLFAGLVFLLDLAPEQPAHPEGSAMAHFFAAFAPTGYLTFVKVCEVLGGLLVAIPRTRCLGLLLLGPIVANIVVFNFCVSGAGIADPMVLGAVLLTVYLVIAERAAFLGLVRRPLPGAL